MWFQCLVGFHLPFLLPCTELHSVYTGGGGGQICLGTISRGIHSEGVQFDHLQES